MSRGNLHPWYDRIAALVFPFAREIIATAVRDGGFPPLMLDPVDLVSVQIKKSNGGLGEVAPA